jgi:hypothetical protein
MSSLSSPVGALLCAAGLARLAKSFSQLSVDEFLGLSMRVRGLFEFGSPVPSACDHAGSPVHI